jgi:hypothetical protein
MKDTQEKKAAKNTKQYFSPVDTGTPKVPLRKSNGKKPQRELLSDWEHAS